MTANRFYVDINPKFSLTKGREKRYCIFDKETFKPVPPLVCKKYDTLSSAMKEAARLNYILTEMK